MWSAAGRPLARLDSVRSAIADRAAPGASRGRPSARLASAEPLVTVATLIGGLALGERDALRASNLILRHRPRAGDAPGTHDPGVAIARTPRADGP